ncbi:MAG: DMT family transporter [Clostridia bacterium]|nr:DMT family transporter [Clostridia bacterium]
MKKSLFSNPIILVLVAMICCALWGSATPAIKTGYNLFEIESRDVASIVLFAGTRFFFAGIFTVIIFSISGRKFLYPKRENITKILTVSVFQTILQYIFFYLGLAFTTGVKGTVASGSGAFFAVIIACLIYKQEKLTFKKVAACVIGFVGILVMNIDSLGFKEDMIIDLMGVGFVLISTVSSSFSSVLIKKYSASENPVVISGYQFIVGGAFMAAVGFIFGGRINFLNLPGILDLVYLALLSAVAYSLWGILLKHNPVSRVTVFNFMTPIFGVLLTLILLPSEDSKVRPLNLVITLVLISLGIFLLNYKRSQKQNGDK